MTDNLVGPGSKLGKQSLLKLPRRVLFINHTAMLDGGEIALLNLVRHVDRSRFTPIVLLFADGALAKALMPDIKVHIIPLEAGIAQTKKD